MATDCCDNGKIVDVTCVHEDGKFTLVNVPRCLPGIYTVRFVAPADYTVGDKIVVQGKDLPVRTPGMAAAASGIFKTGAVIHCDIDLDRELAFFWQGGGSGSSPAVLPNLSYVEQFAGFFDTDGRKVYTRMFDFGILTTAAQLNRGHGIANIQRIVDYKFNLFHPTSNQTQVYSFYIAGTNWINVEMGLAEIACKSSGNWQGWHLLLHIFYTCTDR